MFLPPKLAVAFCTTKMCSGISKRSFYGQFYVLRFMDSALLGLCHVSELFLLWNIK